MGGGRQGRMKGRSPEEYRPWGLICNHEDRVHSKAMLAVETASVERRRTVKANDLRTTLVEKMSEDDRRSSLKWQEIKCADDDKLLSHGSIQQTEIEQRRSDS